MKLLTHLVSFGVFLTTSVCFGAVENLRCEYLVNPLGIDATHPRLSWVIHSGRRGEKQTAYQILVASSEQLLGQDKGDLWDSGKVETDQSAQVEYAGQPLVSREDCFWKVRVWDAAGKPGGWSPAARWQMGLLNAGDWTAQWIGARVPPPPAAARLVIRHAVYEPVQGGNSADVTAALAAHLKDNTLSIVVNNENLGGDPSLNKRKHLRVEYELGGVPGTAVIDENETLSIPEQTVSSPPYLRKSFELKGPVKRAILYATALGLYETHINGQRVGDHILAPDWTDYRHRVRYQAYDVRPLLKKNHNAIGALLGNGWYCGHIGNGGFRFFGNEPEYLAQLEITYADGATEQIGTDTSWKWHRSPILASDFMLGEDYDARLEIAGWDKPGLDDSQWTPATVSPETGLLLEAQVMEPVRVVRAITPKSVRADTQGRWVYDLGQNMVGFVRLAVAAPAGTKVTLRHAEMLNPDGTIYTENLRAARSVDQYVCKGIGKEIWQPQFTFHGFRYVEITGLTGQPQSGLVTGIVISSDTTPAGQFSCSDPRINQLQSNIQWGQRGNYLSVPTDCPQRDERLGWMGDAQVFIRTASYNADIAAFFTKWLVDVDDGQTPQGSFADVSPNTMGANGVPAWGDAGVICPWTIYQVYGDKRILERHLPAMSNWVEYLRAHSNGLIRERDRGNDYGDWLSIGADTPKDLIGTAFFAYSTRLLAQSCQALGRAEDAAKYEALFQDIKAAFLKRYVAPDGHIQGDTQSDYAMALKFDLLPDDLRPKAAQYLVDGIKAKNGHLSTGFIGVSYLLPVLTKMGKADTAYELLLQDTFPSWLFSVKHGATTIWERWDGWTPDKGFQDPGMNSFNHYSLGSCGEYLFGYVGGIRPASPGFKTILIDPTIRDGLTWAKASYNSINGPIATSWKRTNNRLTFEVTIPANTSASIAVPTTNGETVRVNGKHIAKAKAVKYQRTENDKVWLEVGAGTYKFTSEITP
ncbi:MAG: family 78 glycoside hydrolase catalytic domain [Limisphaerales bacterium]